MADNADFTQQFLAGGSQGGSIAQFNLFLQLLTKIQQSIADQNAASAWTPADNSSAALAITVNNARWSVDEAMTFAFLDITYPSTVSGAAASIKGLPTTPLYTTPFLCPGIDIGGTTHIELVLNGSANTAYFANGLTGAALLNSDMSTLRVRVMLSYFSS